MNNISKIRESRGWSQEKLADLMHTTSVSVSRYEREERPITLTLLREMAEIFECRVSDLIGESSPVGGDFVAIPRFDAAFSMGPGSLISEPPEPLGYWQIETQWLRGVSVAAPEQLAIVKADGDSMTPTLLPGDWVLIDRTQRKVTREGIYAIRVGDDVWIKRLSLNLRDKLVRIISDNPVIPLQEIPEEELAIIGRVISIVARRIR